jgi:hypothetical protein
MRLARAERVGWHGAMIRKLLALTAAAQAAYPHIPVKLLVLPG